MSPSPGVLLARSGASRWSAGGGEPPPPGPTPEGRSWLSTNIPMPQYYQDPVEYLNLRMQAGDWGYGGYDGPLTEDGYPTEVVAGSGVYAGFQCMAAETGQYVATFDGDGALAIAIGGSLVSSTSNRYVFNVTGTDLYGVPRSTAFQIVRSNVANPVRNLAIVPIAHENDWQTAVITDRFAEIIAPMQVLRFMDSFSINNTPRQPIEWPNPGWDEADLTKVVTNWNTRTTANYALQATYKGIAIEHAIDMCNVNGSDFWLNIPIHATQNWMTNCAALIASRLNSNLKVYIEYANEVWNDAFHNGADILDLAVAAGFPNEYDSRFGYQNMMMRFMKTALEAVIAPSRVVAVIASQTGFDARIDITLDFPYSYGWYTDGSLGHQHADMLATAPYWGYARAEDPNILTDTVAQVIADIRAEDIPATAADAARNALQATSRGLGFCYYECGQHLFAGDFGNTALQNRLDDINRHADIYQATLDYHNAIGDDISGPMCLFTIVFPFGQYGRWGYMEFMTQTINATPRQCPKYDAALAWSAAHQFP